MNAMRVVSAFLIALSAYLYYLTYDFPTDTAILPRALLILLILCAAGLFFHTGDSLRIKSPGRVGLGSALCLAYLAAIYAFGYYASSAAFVVAVALFLGYRKPLHIALTAVGYPAAIYVVFEICLKIPMPIGAWI